MSEARAIQLVFFDAGGGHRAASEALRTVLAETRPTWHVEVINLQEVLKSSDPLYILSGVPSQDYYNAALKMGLTYGSRAFLRGLQSVIKLCAPRMIEALRQFWGDKNKKLDAVVSLVPNFNAVMFDALRAVRPETPYITIMTDMADCPPHFWQEKQDQYLVCGTAYAIEQAIATGAYRRERLFQTSGMIVRPSFYHLPDKPKLTRADLDLSTKSPTALVMFGGYGSQLSTTIAEKLNSIHVQSIVMCGRNDELRTDLAGIDGCHAVGFTPDVGDYMRLADFFIGKPGPGSLSEAWLMGLPTIVERSAGTMIQERPNVMIMEQMGFGLKVSSFRSIARVVHDMQASGGLERMRRNLRHQHNRAVFEIPDILAEIMTNHVGSGDIVPLKPRLKSRLKSRIKTQKKLALRFAQKWKMRAKRKK